MKGENIAVRLVAFGASVLSVVRALPMDHGGRHIADQLLRSSTSSGANYAEARSAESRRDFAHKAALAAKEAREAHYWLSLVREARLVSADLSAVIREADELTAILSASANTARAAR